MSERLRRSDLLLLALGAGGLICFLLLYTTAFPQASVELEVTREEALQVAREFVGGQGAQLEGYREAVLFTGNSVALTFLQRNLGVEEASRWAREEAPVWLWNMRWFVPQQKEEWIAEVSVDGTIVGFRHSIEEAAEGADLAEEEARARAEALLVSLGWRLADLELVESSTSKRDNRTDHRFLWEKRDTQIEWVPDDPEAGSGSVRLGVTVQGDRVGGYTHFLRVPDEFARQLSQTLTIGQFLAIGSLGLSVVLAIVALVVAIVRYRRDDVRWPPAIAIGVLMFVLMVLFQFTSWPQLEFAYVTEINWGAYIGIIVIVGLLLAAVYGLMVLVMAAAGESLGRETTPASMSGFVDAARGRLLQPMMAVAGLRGYAFAFAFVGYLTVFYLFARRYLGAWLPAEGPYSDIFNLNLPFLMPLTVSLVAAISEEVTYRLFGISVLKKALSGLPDRVSTPIALVVPAAVWAFGHSTYPVYPVYLRGVELTIGGVLFGLIYLRFGLLTCIVAHYVVDAFLLSTPLLSSGNPTYMISGAVAIALALIPAALGLIARIARRSTAGGAPPP